jgi:hypothetical protein
MDLVLPARARKYVYLALIILGLASGAIATGYQALGADLPDWYKAATAVFSFVVAAPATLALLNLRAGDPYLTAVAEPLEVPAAEDNPAVEEADPAAEPDPGQPAA